MEQYFNSLTQLQLIVLSIFALALLVQIIYYFVVYLRPSLNKPPQVSIKQNPISVIICARNECDNLRQFLPKILEQDYPDFEVIVVNDCSVDDTLLLLGEMELKYKNLRHTNIEVDRKFAHGKKLAITIGLKSAKNEYVVLTDADCYPVSNQWLADVEASYSDKTEFVLGYGGYETRNGLLNKLIRYDTLSIAMQYLGLAKIHHPYMGVGRNISYRRSTFFGGSGFQSHYHLTSGDDDLFVNEFATKNNTCILTTKSSITRSIPCERFADWVKQKKRHLSTWTHYRAGTKFCLSIELLSRLLFYVALIVTVYPLGLYIEAASAYVLRLIVQIIVYKLNMRKFEERGFLFLIPIFDVVLPVFHLAFNILNLRDKRCQ